MLLSFLRVLSGGPQQMFVHSLKNKQDLSAHLRCSFESFALLTLTPLSMPKRHQHLFILFSGLAVVSRGLLLCWFGSNYAAGPNIWLCEHLWASVSFSRTKELLWLSWACTHTWWCHACHSGPVSGSDLQRCLRLWRSQRMTSAHLWSMEDLLTVTW